MVGEAKGQNKPSLYPVILKQSLIYILFCVLLFALFFWGFNQQIAELYTHHPEVIKAFINNTPYMLCALLCASFAYAFDGFYIGITSGHTLMWSMVFAALVGFLPLGFLGWKQGSSALLWGGFISFMALRSGSLALLFFRNYVKVPPLEKEDFP